MYSCSCGLHFATILLFLCSKPTLSPLKILITIHYIILGIYLANVSLKHKRKWFSWDRLIVSLFSLSTFNSFLTSGFHHSLQDDHDLKVLLLQLCLWHVPESWACINLMGDDQRRDQEEAIISRLKAHTDVCLVQRDKLTCRRRQNGRWGWHFKTLCNNSLVCWPQHRSGALLGGTQCCWWRMGKHFSLVALRV